MKNFTVTVGASVCGFCAGLFLASGGNNTSFVKTFSLAGLMSLPTVFVAHLIVDSQATQKINKAEEQIGLVATEASQAKVLLSSIELKNVQLVQELATLHQTLESVESDRAKSTTTASTLQHMVADLQQRLEAAGERVEDLEAEVSEWETQFNDRVAVEAEQRLKQARNREIQMITSEHRAISQEAMQLYEALRQWGLKIAHGHSTKRELIVNLVSAYNNNLDDLNQLVDKERDQYLQQIEALRERVGLLQHELNGDLVEPSYGQFGYSLEGRIANDIARRFWEELRIPLSVQGFQMKSDGSVDVGYGYSRSVPVDALLSDLSRHSGDIAKSLGIHKITSIRKLEISDLVILTFRREPALKESEINQLVGTAQEFTRYIVSNQIRYRLIADPHSGKTPTTAVMLSAILSSGTRQANTEKGAKVPHTLVAVAYPGRESSLKDERYPLDLFLKYATEASAVKSFGDAVEDWKYRKTHTSYAKQFFQIWCWDEFDNTIASASDPKGVAEDIKQLLKQAHHTNQGWIFSGQSVMTSQIPGFTNDDRSLFIEIVIGIPKIRKYLETYGKQRNSDETLGKLRKSLDAIQDHVEHQNDKITDEARQLRVALVMDSRSPKLFFLPNLDDVNFDVNVITESEKLASQVKSGSGVHPSPVSSGSPDAEKYNADGASVTAVPSGRPKSTIPHCPECGSSNVSALKDGRYRCRDCGVKRAVSKVIWK
jgi:DNA-directed RNA polymerase subunit RPC12/RpoP